MKVKLYKDYGEEFSPYETLVGYSQFDNYTCEINIEDGVGIYDLNTNKLTINFVYGFKVANTRNYNETFYLEVNGEVLLNNVVLTGDSTQIKTISKTFNCNQDGSSPDIVITASFPVLEDTKTLTLTSKPVCNGKIKVNNHWKNCFAFVKKNNNWKRSVIWKKINGVWKRGV